MKRLKLSKELTAILVLFFSWRIALLLVSILAIRFVSLGSSDRYLGGGFTLYHLSPQIFSWANFDGEHYLSIAIFGYKMLEQAFFPVYPLLIRLFATPFSYDLFSSLLNSTIAGILISNASFLLAIVFLFKLISLDFSKKIAFITLLSLLTFPLSFYFGAVYNESLFLLLSVLSFYFARQKRWFLASVFGLVASATRVFGVLLLPTLLIEAYLQKEKFSKIFWIFLIPLGLGGYMLYQYVTFGDPLAFYNLQTAVGEQHQPGVVLLPQVYFRYIKMILTVDKSNPIYQTIWLEFLVGIIFFVLPVYGYFKRIRLSYLFYAMIGFILPTIQGSFSSSPRYVIIFFPAFLALAILLNNLPRAVRLAYLILSALFLGIETALFLRGYWVA